MSTVLDLFLNDTHIGTIVNDANDRNIVLFEPDYVADQNRLTLGQAFMNASGEFLANQRPTQRRLSTFFANLLPEGPMRDMIADRANVNRDRDFPILWLTGSDLPGALEVRARDGGIPPPDIRPRIGARKRSEISKKSDVLRFSLAGMQLKFSAMRTDSAFRISHDGRDGHWIVKPPDSRFKDVPLVEFATMQFAKSIGLDVPEIQLIAQDEIENLPATIPDGKVYAIKRFDRLDDGRRVQIEDFAQVFGVYPTNAGKYHSANYRNIADVLLALNGIDAVEEFVRRLVFNFLIGNADMHVKNWSLIYPDGRTPRLAPAYDYVSTVLYLQGDSFGLSLVKGLSYWSDLSYEAFDLFSTRVGVPKKRIRAVIEDTVERVVRTWSRDTAASKTHFEAVRDHMKRIPLVTGVQPARPRGRGRARTAYS